MKKSLAWGYLSQFLQYGAGLLILPILLKKLSSAELGIWYVYMTISVLVTILDMGFTPSFTRNISYILAGAKNLLSIGFEDAGIGEEVQYPLLKSLVKTSKKIFICIALVSFLLLSTFGTWYVLKISHGEIQKNILIMSWAIFIVATVINLYYKYLTPLLQGSDKYIEFYKANAIANVCFVIVTALLISMVNGLLAISIGYLISALVGRWLSGKYFYGSAVGMHLSESKLCSLSSLRIFMIIWPNAWRAGLGVLGSFLILRSNTLLASNYLGLEVTASYALTLQLFAVLQSLSAVLFVVQQPKMMQLRIKSSEKKLLKNLVIRSIGFSLILFFFGFLVILFFGENLITFIHGRTQLLPLKFLILIGIMGLLELNHSLAVGFIGTGNSIPFVKSALISGCAILIISWAGLNYHLAGIEWLIITQFIVQLIYNNWFWPLKAFAELKS